MKGITQIVHHDIKSGKGGRSCPVAVVPAAVGTAAAVGIAIDTAAVQAAAVPSVVMHEPPSALPQSCSP